MVSASRLGDLTKVLGWGTLRAGFRDRVEAAASAGFDAIGLRIQDYQGLRANGHSDADLRSVLESNSIELNEIEALWGFAAEPGPAGLAERPWLVYNDPELEATAFHMADTFGSSVLQTTGVFQKGPTTPGTAAAFAAVADRAAAHGLRVSLEFVPFTDIPDVAVAAQIAEEAERPNAGVCVDSWQFFRGSLGVEALNDVDVRKIFMIQINDGTYVPEGTNILNDSMSNRRLPGQGEFDLVGFLRAMDRPGLDATISVEVFSDKLAELAPKEAAKKAMEATVATLALAGAA